MLEKIPPKRKALQSKLNEKNVQKKKQQSFEHMKRSK